MYMETLNNEQKILVEDIKLLVTGGIWKMLITDETWCSLFRLSISDFFYYLDSWIINNNFGNVFGKNVNTVDICMGITTSTIDTQLLMAKYFSEEVGLSSRGTRYELKRGSLDLEIGRQVYEVEPNREIKHVFFATNSQIDNAKFASWYNNVPFAFGGGGASGALGFAGASFGGGGFGQMYHLFPAFDVVLRAMNMGLNQKILKSDLTYKITKSANGGRLLHLFSVPDSSTVTRVAGCKVIYEYYDTSGLDATDKEACEQECAKIYSPTQFETPKIEYNSLNAFSKNFIRKWLIAMAMKTEGMARSRFKGKIANIGGVDIELDYDTLIADSRESLQELKTEIKEFLLDLRSDKIAERKAKEVTDTMTALAGIPLKIEAI